jgi:hypothetical protein
VEKQIDSWAATGWAMATTAKLKSTRRELKLGLKVERSKSRLERTEENEVYRPRLEMKTRE